MSAFHRIMERAAAQTEAELVLVDVGPNLGALNRAALVASDFVVVPLGADVFSLQGLRNLGPTLAQWRRGWTKRLDNEARPEELRHAIEPLIALLTEQVDGAMKAGVVRAGDPRRLAVLIHHLVSGQIHGVLLGTVAEDDAERTGEELWEFCARAIQAG